MTGADHPIRFVTAASLFDGHDAAINIMRRILQAEGVEVIHLGHNRSVDEVVRAAVAEDVHGIALSSYQGGHIEYFTYLVDRLAEEGAGHIKVFGGGGGVIIDSEIARLAEIGVSIFSPDDGQRMGLVGMIRSVVEQAAAATDARPVFDPTEITRFDHHQLARSISAIENGLVGSDGLAALASAASLDPAPVLGITGTGGSGKSSLTDELIRRFRLASDDDMRIAVLAIDPTRRKGGGALLGDRIRMNSIESPQIYYRSLATRSTTSEVPPYLDDLIAATRVWGADLVIVETPGIGQGDAAIVPHSDVSLYVMTPEFGAASQLEKIDMLDFADVVAINKFDRRGAEDAKRDVARQLVRNREAFDLGPDDMPVFGTMASHFDDAGVSELARHLGRILAEHGLPEPGLSDSRLSESDLESRRATSGGSERSQVVPPARVRYLAEIAETVRGYHDATETAAGLASTVASLETARRHIGSAGDTGDGDASADASLQRALEDLQARRDPSDVALLEAWEHTSAELGGADRPTRESLSGTAIPKLALPRHRDPGDLLRWLRSENLPGYFPFTAGVFPFKRENEDPARMFAGEGGPARTNRRFHMLAEGQPATRLSTAFDSVTLYGRDPAHRPDIFGKIGNSGVSIATLDDMKQLYDGFDLCDPTTSVSMTINGPAPTVLAMFLNTAIDQRLDAHTAEVGRPPTDAEAAEIRVHVLSTVRGTVQADVLKEDQGQNTCIFSTEFSLAMMGDIAEWFVDNRVRNFYSVSISGYHIAEAGANPITQLAFTLANGFTYVEAYLARGLDIDDFAPNLSFFFSNGMDPEYNVLGRVARRIWSVAMRDRYGANERSQKLKYHVQTSGRSLHAQEMAFNDIRTTLQALCAIYDNANSLHTNAYDEAVTTPTDESVRRALAIQLVINREWGLAMCENPLQGSFIIEELTDLVEEAVLVELDRISDRGGVLGAMETGYQRGRIQDESMLYERRKHDGSIPIIGVNTFTAPADEDANAVTIPLARSTDVEKLDQIERLEAFHQKHAHDAPAALEKLRDAVVSGDNVFDTLMDTVRHCSLGQITDALFEVGGSYRRNV